MTAAQGSSDAGSSSAASPTTQDALDLLHDDHRRIDALLADCERLVASPQSSSADRSGLISRLGALLIAHGQLEQQLFYPALGAPAAEIDDAVADHEEIKRSLLRLSEVDAPPASFDECIKTLALRVREHISAEEGQLFARARSSGIDLHELGSQLALRRAALLGDQGVD